MNKKTLKSDIILIVASSIWGLAFVAQVKGMEYVGPFLYNAIRFSIGTVFLVPISIFLSKGKKYTPSKLPKKKLLLSGFLIGLILFVAATLQQVGLMFTTAGKAGFITGLYVILVPILGISIKHKTGLPTWVGAFFAVIGLFLISLTSDLTIKIGDLLVLISSLFFALHILAIDNVSKKIPPLIIAINQFFWCSIFSFILAIIYDNMDLDLVLKALVPILYGGIGSVGIAFTLQIIAQKNAPPAHSAIIMTLESVVALIGGMIFLSEQMSPRGLVGCLIMLTGMIASQWDVIFRKKLP